MSTTDDWLYSDDLDVDVQARVAMASPAEDVDGVDLLDDVLTAPSNHMNKGHTPSNEDELLDMDNLKPENAAMEGVDSGSARFNAEQMAKKAQARMEALGNSGVRCIYSREPNRKNAFFIGNLTWWTTDEDVILAVKEAELGDVLSIKFYENRANGQSKGYALVELTAESLATSAQSKIESLMIHNQKPVVAYALRMSPHQFEGKCNSGKGGVSNSSSSTSISSNSSYNAKHRSQGSQGTPSQPTTQSVAAPTGLPPGFPPIFPPGLPGFRPPGMDPLGLMGALPPPPTLPGMPPVPPFNFMGRPPMAPGMPPMPTGLDQIKASGNAPHLNPAFIQEMASQSAHQGSMQKMAELFDRFRQGSGMDSRKPQVSDEEVADANQRNKAISSSAISRALNDANAGEYEGAVDMLRMAVTLIRQSITANTETSQILIQSLQDCLRSIEDQSSSRRSRRDRDDRDRSRSSHRSASSKYYRDRSRERRR